MLGQGAGVVAGVLLGRESVDAAAQALDVFGNPRRAAVRGALEHQVLDEVREPVEALALVARAALHPHAYRDRGRVRYALGDDPEPVVEAGRTRRPAQLASPASSDCLSRSACSRSSGRESRCASLRLNRIFPCRSTSSTFTGM